MIKSVFNRFGNLAGWVNKIFRRMVNNQWVCSILMYYLGMLCAAIAIALVIGVIWVLYPFVI